MYRPLAFLLASPLVLLPWIALSYLCFLLLALLLTGRHFTCTHICLRRVDKCKSAIYTLTYMHTHRKIIGVPEQFTLGTPMAAISLTLLAIYFLTMGLVARYTFIHPPCRPPDTYVCVRVYFH